MKKDWTIEMIDPEKFVRVKVTVEDLIAFLREQETKKDTSQEKGKNTPNRQ